MNKDMVINSLAVPPEKQALYGKENFEEYVHNFTHYFGHIFENKKPLVQHELLKFYTRDASTSGKYFYLHRLNEVCSLLLSS
jgi:ABC-type transport system involved in cytochrome c biogenesis ATPase subunit